MAAPGTAPERFVMVGADSDAARFDRALSVPKKYGRAERARSFRISWVVAARSRQGHLIDRIRFRRDLVRQLRGSGVQGTRGSGFTGFRGSGGNGGSGVYRRFHGSEGERGLGGTADLALIQKFIVHRIHTPRVDVDEPS